MRSGKETPGNKRGGNRSALGAAGSAIVLHLGTRPSPSLFTGSLPSWPLCPHVATGHITQWLSLASKNRAPSSHWSSGDTSVTDLSWVAQETAPSTVCLSCLFLLLFQEFSTSEGHRECSTRCGTTDSQGQGEERKGMKEESNIRKL